MANVTAAGRIEKSKGDSKRQSKEKGYLYVAVRIGRRHSSGADDERGRVRM